MPQRSRGGNMEHRPFTSESLNPLDLIDKVKPREFDAAVHVLRTFFKKRGFVEVPVQHRLSILAACEDPHTIATFNYLGQVWPLPQTGQMWLEYELFNDPDAQGFFCVSYSYREESRPKPGRHNMTFPMFEFETRGNIEALIALERDLLAFLGFGARDSFMQVDYRETAARYGVSELNDEHEKRLCEEFGNVVLLTRFPQFTSPFWNMKKNDDVAEKVDCLLFGQETIGSSERSTNPDEMRELFYSISDGKYADVLFSKFGRVRVEKELDEFLAHKFIPRFGGGIGMTRMIRALNLNSAGKL